MIKSCYSFTPDIHVHSLSSHLMGQPLSPCSSCSTYMSIVSVLQSPKCVLPIELHPRIPRILKLQKGSLIIGGVCFLCQACRVLLVLVLARTARVQAMSSNQSFPYAVANWTGSLSCRSFRMQTCRSTDAQLDHT